MPDNRRFRGRAQINLGGLSGLSDSSLTAEDPNFDNESFAQGGTGEATSPSLINNGASYPRYQKPSWWNNFMSGGQASKDFNQYNFQSDLARANAMQHESTQLKSNNQTNDFANQRMDREYKLKDDSFKTQSQIEQENAAKSDYRKHNLGIATPFNVPYLDQESFNQNLKTIGDPGNVDTRLAAELGPKIYQAREAGYKTKELEQNEPAMLGASGANADFNKGFAEYRNSLKDRIYPSMAFEPVHKAEESAARASALSQIPLTPGASIFNKGTGQIDYKAPMKPGDILMENMLREDGMIPSILNNNSNKPSMNSGKRTIKDPKTGKVYTY